MTGFSGFAPPRDKLALRSDRFACDIWPETGGAVACFHYLTPRGERVALFRPTVEKARYQPTDLACWPLLPFSNRVAQGRFRFGGAEHRLPLNVAGVPHALHGVGWQSAWRVLSAQADRCVIALDHEANESWPFSFTARQAFTLNDDGLTIETTLVNSDARPAPYGLGQHPYLARPCGSRLYAPVDAVWLTDETVLPTQRVDLPPHWDLRMGVELDRIALDNCFEPLRGAARLVWPDGGELSVLASDNLGFLVVYNPPGDDFVCVEPVSHRPDAFNRTEQGAGVAVLAPGESATATHRFVWRPAAA